MEVSFAQLRVLPSLNRINPVARRHPPSDL
jgi:hypothetical protein